MTQELHPYKGHWQVQIVPDPGNPNRPAADPNGTHYGVTFTNGWAYVSWKQFGTFETGENAARVAIQQLGRDGRFVVTEIPGRVYRNESEAK